MMPSMRTLLVLTLSGGHGVVAFPADKAGAGILDKPNVPGGIPHSSDATTTSVSVQSVHTSSADLSWDSLVKCATSGLSGVSWNAFLPQNELLDVTRLAMPASPINLGALPGDPKISCNANGTIIKGMTPIHIGDFSTTFGYKLETVWAKNRAGLPAPKGAIAAVYGEDLDFNDIKILGKSIPKTSIYVVGYKLREPKYTNVFIHAQLGSISMNAVINEVAKALGKEDVDIDLLPEFTEANATFCMGKDDGDGVNGDAVKPLSPKSKLSVGRSVLDFSAKTANGVYLDAKMDIASGDSAAAETVKAIVCFLPELTDGECKTDWATNIFVPKGGDWSTAYIKLKQPKATYDSERFITGVGERSLKVTGFGKGGIQEAVMETKAINVSFPTQFSCTLVPNLAGNQAGCTLSKFKHKASVSMKATYASDTTYGKEIKVDLALTSMNWEKPFGIQGVTVNTLSLSFIYVWGASMVTRNGPHVQMTTSFKLDKNEKAKMSYEENLKSAVSKQIKARGFDNSRTVHAEKAVWKLEYDTENLPIHPPHIDMGVAANQTLHDHMAAVSAGMVQKTSFGSRPAIQKCIDDYDECDVWAASGMCASGMAQTLDPSTDGVTAASHPMASTPFTRSPDGWCGLMPCVADLTFMMSSCQKACDMVPLMRRKSINAYPSKNLLAHWSPVYTADACNEYCYSDSKCDYAVLGVGTEEENCWLYSRGNWGAGGVQEGFASGGCARNGWYFYNNFAKECEDCPSPEYGCDKWLTDAQAHPDATGFDDFVKLRMAAADCKAHCGDQPTMIESSEFELYEKSYEECAGISKASTLFKSGNICLNVHYGTATSGQKVNVWTCSESYSQKWILDGDNIKYAHNTAFCLNVKDGTATSGQTINLWECDGSSSQKWVVDGDRIRYAASPSYCLNLHNDAAKNDGIVNLWYCNGANSQDWFNLWSYYGYYTTPTNGEEACEGHGYSEDECYNHGCCHYDAPSNSKTLLAEWGPVYTADACNALCERNSQCDYGVLGTGTKKLNCFLYAGRRQCWSAVGQGQCIAKDFMSGEMACENQGLDEGMCLALGCCYWSGFTCMSNVGVEKCPGVDFRTKDQACSGSSHTKDDCEKIGCCTYNSVAGKCEATGSGLDVCINPLSSTASPSIQIGGGTLPAPKPKVVTPPATKDHKFHVGLQLPIGPPPKVAAGFGVYFKAENLTGHDIMRLAQKIAFGEIEVEPPDVLKMFTLKSAELCLAPGGPVNFWMEKSNPKGTCGPGMVAAVKLKVFGVDATLDVTADMSNSTLDPKVPIILNVTLNAGHVNNLADKMVDTICDTVKSQVVDWWWLDNALRTFLKALRVTKFAFNMAFEGAKLSEFKTDIQVQVSGKPHDLALKVGAPFNTMGDIFSQWGVKSITNSIGFLDFPPFPDGFPCLGAISGICQNTCLFAVCASQESVSTAVSVITHIADKVKDEVTSFVDHYESRADAGAVETAHHADEVSRHLTDGNYGEAAKSGFTYITSGVTRVGKSFGFGRMKKLKMMAYNKDEAMVLNHPNATLVLGYILKHTANSHCLEPAIAIGRTLDPLSKTRFRVSRWQMPDPDAPMNARHLHSLMASAYDHSEGDYGSAYQLFDPKSSKGKGLTWGQWQHHHVHAVAAHHVEFMKKRMRARTARRTSAH